MAKRKSSTAEDLFDLIAMMPWWAGVALAVVAYVWLHSIAVAPAPTLGTTAQMGAFVAGQFGKTLAMFGQYLLPFICLAGAAASAYGRAKRSRLAEDVAKSPTANALNDMSWQEFELLVGEAFRRQGFAVSETGGGGADGGVDLVLTQGKEKFFVQCKQWRAFKVGVGVVRELYGVMAANGATGGYVISSGQFSPEAREFATGRNITLMDGAALHALIADVPRQPAIVNALACPQCGSRMVRRTARRGANAGGDFWGCSRYPACRGIRAI